MNGENIFCIVCVGRVSVICMNVCKEKVVIGSLWWKFMSVYEIANMRNKKFYAARLLRDSM